MPGATSDVWEAMSTARTIRRFTDEPVDDATLERCLQAAMWAPSGANAQAWRFVVLRSPEQRAVVAKAATHALEVIEPVYGMSRPAADDDSRRARTNRATYELHDRAGEFTSILFAEAFPDGLGAATRWLDLPGHAEFPAGRARSGSGGVPDQLGRLRRRAVAAERRRRARRLDVGRAHRDWLAEGAARAGAAPTVESGGQRRHWDVFEG
jgi:nitroreductase